jgi:hypothetical protein
MEESQDATIEQAGEVAGAATAAAAAEQTPEAARHAAANAARTAAKHAGLSISEEDARMIAAAIVAELEARGAFDPPPQITTPKIETEEPAEQPEPPRKRSFAEWFQTR